MKFIAGIAVGLSLMAAALTLAQEPETHTDDTSVNCVTQEEHTESWTWSGESSAAGDTEIVALPLNNLTSGDYSVSVEFVTRSRANPPTDQRGVQLVYTYDLQNSDGNFNSPGSTYKKAPLIRKAALSSPTTEKLGEGLFRVHDGMKYFWDRLNNRPNVAEGTDAAIFFMPQRNVKWVVTVTKLEPEVTEEATQ